MLTTIKDFFDEIALIPKAVKITVSAVLLFAIGFAVFYGVRTAVLNARVERLEKQNRELNQSAQTAMQKASRAEINAANEALRADSLDSKIKTLEAKEKLADVKIQNQSQKSSDLRLSLDRVRQSQPANTSTAELERRLRDRYGEKVRSQ
jgi:hypothetical protein